MSTKCKYVTYNKILILFLNFRLCKLAWNACAQELLNLITELSSKRYCFVVCNPLVRCSEESFAVYPYLKDFKNNLLMDPKILRKQPPVLANLVSRYIVCYNVSLAVCLFFTHSFVSVTVLQNIGGSLSCSLYFLRSLLPQILSLVTL